MSDRWEELQALFAGAVEQKPEDRVRWLEQATVNSELRDEVTLLLAAADRPGRLDGITAYLGSSGENPPQRNHRQRLETALTGRYRLERELGRGGTAIVYLAEDLKHRRPVALKLLLPDIASQLGPRRFQREIETAARLTHPHILPLHDSGEANGLCYFVMPFVDGESLRDRLARESRLPFAEAISIAREVADALSFAHAQGIVHRDIKPDNILFAGGHALVADFGVARAIDAAGGDRLTESGITIGTPAYMSPEQALGGAAVDQRSDIFSLGCVVYEMIGGAVPFAGPTNRAVLARLALDPTPPLRQLRPDVPSKLQEVIERALAKAPAERFQAAREFGDALQEALLSPGEPTRAPEPIVPSPHRRILLGTLLTAVLIGAWWLACRP